LDFQMANKGFASPFNPRNLEIILRNALSNQKYRLVTETDPRFWMAGDTIYVSITGGIPADMEEGNYTAFLFLADPVYRLHDNPDYAIKLANNNLWEDSTGYNSLNHQLKITINATGPTYTGTNFFELFNGVSEVEFEEPISPVKYTIDVYPNPFNGTTTIEFNINPQDVAEAQIFDAIGRLIKTFKPFEYSSKRIIWNSKKENSKELSSGLYIFVLRTKENLYSKKLLLLK
ncbi:MAG: DUF4832 domain-containing protein, partial [Ignavibacteria bacterium]|nr:DUF4832 domain-containing protein [Ignavibacteria bacterium]